MLAGDLLNNLAIPRNAGKFVPNAQLPSEPKFEQDGKGSDKGVWNGRTCLGPLRKHNAIANTC